MPRGQAAHSGKWNFQIRRYKCPKCEKKGLYETSNNGWICCMYCKYLLTENWTEEFKKVKAMIEKIKDDTREHDWKRDYSYQWLTIDNCSKCGLKREIFDGMIKYGDSGWDKIKEPKCILQK